MIGAKSITLTLKIANKKNPAITYPVVLQANRNYGLCDVVLPNEPVAPVKDYSFLPKDKQASGKTRYEEQKKEYDKEITERKAIRSNILNTFQGRQLNSSVVDLQIKEALTILLNSAEA